MVEEDDGLKNLPQNMEEEIEVRAEWCFSSYPHLISFKAREKHIYGVGGWWWQVEKKCFVVDFEGKMGEFMGLVEERKPKGRSKRERKLGGFPLFWAEPFLFYFSPLPSLCSSVGCCAQVWLRPRSFLSSRWWYTRVWLMASSSLCSIQQQARA